jgi:hypothetical protein
MNCNVAWTPGAKYACDWMRFCMSEQFYESSWRFGYVYQPRKNLRIVEIDGLNDLLAVLDEFGTVDSRMAQLGFPRRYPNWQEMAKHFDAIHLTEKGQWETRFSRPNDLYGWDTESTLFLRLHRNTLKFVKKLRFGVGGRRFSRQECRRAPAFGDRERASERAAYIRPSIHERLVACPQATEVQPSALPRRASLPSGRSRRVRVTSQKLQLSVSKRYSVTRASLCRESRARHLVE